MSVAIITGAASGMGGASHVTGETLTATGGSAFRWVGERIAAGAHEAFRASE